MVKCNVPLRGWVNGIGGCPNVGGICMACTMPGFPDKYMPFMQEDTKGRISANFARFTYGPVLRTLRGPVREADLRRRARVAQARQGAHDRIPEAMVTTARIVIRDAGSSEHGAG